MVKIVDKSQPIPPEALVLLSELERIFRGVADEASQESIFELAEHLHQLQLEIEKVKGDDFWFEDYFQASNEGKRMFRLLLKLDGLAREKIGSVEKRKELDMIFGGTHKKIFGKGGLVDQFVEKKVKEKEGKGPKKN